MEMPQLINSLQEFAKDNDVDIHISIGRNDELNRQVVEHFIYSSDFQIDNFIYTDNNDMVDFDDNTEEKYYSVNSNDSNALKVKVLDDYYSTGMLYSIQSYRPFHQLKDAVDDGYSELCVNFYEEDQIKMKQLKESLKREYSIYIRIINFSRYSLYLH